MNLNEPLLDSQIEGFPGLTSPEVKRCCRCFCKYTYIPNIKATFLGEWEISLCMPMFVIILMISSFAMYLLAMPDVWGKLFYYIALGILSYLFLIWITSYIMVIKVGPGYYPFYAATNSKYPYTPEKDLNQLIESPFDGVISTEKQYKWAHEGDMPPRCILSKSARRIVIKPDHLCGWTATWIGKRNFKPFILFNVYGVLYTAFYAFSGWKKIYLVFKNNLKMDFTTMMFLLMLIFASTFCMLCLGFVISGCTSACQNRTSWEKWNNIDVSKYNKGKCNNLEDTCGDKNCKLLWIFPVPPFRGKTNGELVASYDRYTRHNRDDD